MKIALVCTEKLPVPPIAGGAVQLYIDGILPYLSKKHEITVFGIQYDGLEKKEEVDGIKYIRVPSRNTQEYLTNLKAELTDNYDLVHIFNRPLWVLNLSKELPNTMFSLSLHNEMFHPEKISKIDGEECISRVEFITTVSRFIADGVQKLYPMAKDKLNVVYSGVDSNIYDTSWTQKGQLNKAELKEKYNLKDYRVILNVGRLSVKKGTHVLLRAVKEVMEQDENAALVIVGSKWYGDNKEDDYTRFVRRLAEELSGPVIFTGFIPPKDIPKYYSIGDIFICPSQWNEPLARVHYEAMAAGLPIITTNRGGNAEVISGYNNGVVINDYNNPQSFAKEISFLLENPEQSLNFGKAGRELALEKYSWERVSNDLLSLIDKISEKKLNYQGSDIVSASDEDRAVVNEEEFILPDF